MGELGAQLLRLDLLDQEDDGQPADAEADDELNQADYDCTS